MGHKKIKLRFINARSKKFNIFLTGIRDRLNTRSRKN